MSQRTSGETPTAERRYLIDRRSPTPRRAQLDRRRRQRRCLNLRVARNRRRGVERRRAERRRLADRRMALVRRRTRRDTPSPFTAPQISEVKRSFAAPGSRAKCPACGGTFTLGRAHRRGEKSVRRIRCSSCGKTAVVSDTSLCRVLVIAQKTEIRDALRTILGSAGHEIAEAADAGVGLWAYRESPADVVFIDVAATGRLPATEFIRQLRKEFTDARVVAMSARASYGTGDPLAVAKQFGAARTMRVPCPGTEILKALEETRP